MLKIISVIVLSLLIGGCAMQSNKEMSSSKIFQSVEEKDATLVQKGKNKGSCSRCGMDLVKFYKTSHIAEHEGTHFQYCSIHCLEEHLGNEITLKNPKVVDVVSLKLIPVSDAHYVVGSKIRGTMSRVSKYAFLNLEDAKKFQTKNGGEIMDFNGALEKAKEDFKHYK
ncbi:nitrous oxide reductase accessory protein NosL [bacterium]|nr:nitrous oxide reductase accessory protein NosL [bacterium]MBU1994259.1 nitrous oxide reductase accessory protein NosL [bacterium]